MKRRSRRKEQGAAETEESVAVLLVRRAGRTRRLSRQSDEGIRHVAARLGVTLLVYDAGERQHASVNVSVVE